METWFPVADPGFTRGGGANSPGGANIRFCQFFPKTAWNWKNLDPGEGGGARPKFYYVDPPLVPIETARLFMCLLHGIPSPVKCFMTTSLQKSIWQFAKKLIFTLLCWLEVLHG